MLIGSQRNDGRVLYALAIEKRKRDGRVVCGFEYVHAKDRGEALMTYFASRPGPGVFVADVAPVVGVFGEEKKGNLITCV